MEELQVGDVVFDHKGLPTKVIKTTLPYIPDRCYKVTFSDHTSIIADADHQWTIKDNAGWRVVTTEHLASRHQLPNSPERINRDLLVTSIEPVLPRPVKCIEVDSPSHLYLAGKGCTPTHNSLFGSISGIQEACIPGSIGWACAPSNPKLHRYVIPAFQALLPPDWVADWDGEYLDLRLTNGSLIHFQTLEDPDQGRGQGLNWLWIDEVCELSDKHWDVISPSLADKQGVAFFTTSPRSYDWVYERLFRPAEEGVPGFWALKARTADNPIFQTEDGQAFLAREKSQKSDEMYRQEYEADFVHFTGAVYGPELDTQILHTREKVQEIIPEWPDIAPTRIVGLGVDTGADHPFGAVKVVSTERGMVVVGDYLERHKSYAEHAILLKGLAGTSSARWAINKNERQGMIELAQYGIFCQPAENDQVAGIERVKAWLLAKQLWFVEETAKRTIKQMKSYRWADNTSKDGQLRKEKVYKRDDELPDGIRYFLMTWPTLPAPLIEEPMRDISHLPLITQQEIERMRRIEKAEKEEYRDIDKEPVISRDFWGAEVNEWQ